MEAGSLLASGGVDGGASSAAAGMGGVKAAAFCGLAREPVTSPEASFAGGNPNDRAAGPAAFGGAFAFGAVLGIVEVAIGGTISASRLAAVSAASTAGAMAAVSLRPGGCFATA